MGRDWTLYYTIDEHSRKEGRREGHSVGSVMSYFSSKPIVTTYIVNIFAA